MAAALLLCGSALVGCAGQVGEQELEQGPGTAAPKPGAQPNGQPGPKGAPAQPAPESSSGGQTGSMVAIPPVAKCSGKTTLGPSGMRRLTNAEYIRTVRDLFALAPEAPLGLDLPGETRVASFENNATVQSLSEQHLGQYLAGAEKLTAGLLGDAKRRDVVVGCSPAGATRAACTKSFIAKFGRRAFRRPLTEEEQTRFTALAAKGDGEPDPYAGLERVMQSMIVSANFLFLVEGGTPDKDRGGALRLGGHEMGARLAYLLWGTAPDDALLDAAAAGKLDTSAGVLETTRAMLKDPRAKDAHRQFASRWLQVDLLPETHLDAKKYPGFDETLRRSMQEETLRLVDDLVTRPGASFLDLVTADHGFLDAALAKTYGLPAPASPFARVQFPAGQRGGGILTHGSFLALTGEGETAAPIKRGLFVRQVLLCQMLPPPPPDIPAIDEVKLANATLREKLAAHEKDPACSGCHTMLDPIGFGLSQYDAVGAWKPTDSRGRALDARGRIEGLAEADFDGPRQLGERLRNAPEFSECVTRQLFRFANARLETPEDACTLSALHETFTKAKHSYPALLEAIVQTDTFRYRRPAAGGTP